MKNLSFWTVLLGSGLLLEGCEGPAPGGDERGTDTATPSEPEGLQGFAAGACASGGSALDVRFTTEVPTVAVIEYGPTDAYGHTTLAAATPTTTHHLQVPTFPPGQAWHWRAVARDGAGEWASDDRVFTAAPAASDLPDLDLESTAGGYTSGWRTLPMIGETAAWVLVVNDTGAVVWSKAQPEGIGVTRTRPRPGGGLYALEVDTSRRQDLGRIVTLDWCGERRDEVDAPWAHHDFVVREDGSFAFLAVDIRDVDGKDVVGDTLVEMHADGSGVTPVWSTWDAMNPHLEADCEPEFYPQGCDWTHGNGLSWDAERQTYYVSLHNLNTVAAVVRGDGAAGSGSTSWFAGGAVSTFAFPDPDVAWTHQHGFKRVGGDEYVVFDNGYSNGEYSQGRRVHLDPATQLATSTWSWTYDQEHSSTVLGDILLLDSGNYLLGWGSEGELTEVTPSGELVWRATFALGAGVVGFMSFDQALGGEVP